MVGFQLAKRVLSLGLLRLAAVLYLQDGARHHRQRPVTTSRAVHTCRERMGNVRAASHTGRNLSSHTCVKSRAREPRMHVPAEKTTSGGWQRAGYHRSSNARVAPHPTLPTPAPATARAEPPSPPHRVSCCSCRAPAFTRRDGHRPPPPQTHPSTHPAGRHGAPR